MLTAGQPAQPDGPEGDALLNSHRQLLSEIDRLNQEIARFRDSEEQYRMIFERAAAGFAHVDLQGQFVNVNEKLCEMLGYTRDELLARTWYSITHPAHLPTNLSGNERMRTGEVSTYTTDKQYIRKDGQPLWVHLTVSLVRTPEGQAKYFVAVMDDISERKKEQELLRQSQLRLQSILDNTTACIYMKDVAGRYELINRRFEELFHVSSDYLKGRTDFEIFPTDIAQRLRANDSSVIAAGSPLVLEEIVLQDDGPHTYISIKVPLRDDTGNAVGICGISTDITERKRAEARLLETTNAANEANRAKTQFLANISHEIRTPIMAILAAAEMVHQGDVAGEDAMDHGEVILRSGRHLLSLVDDLIDQSQIEVGRLEVIRDSCSLPDILADIDAVAQPLVSDDVTLQFFYDTDVPRHIHTDRKRLTQAIVNLLHNAIKFTKTGHIYVRVRIDHVEHSPFLTVRVEDTGRGISNENLNRIFEPFTQLDVGLSQVRSGIGLGLALAKSIVLRLGGTLNVQSQLGVGSVFSLTVPVGPISAHDWVSRESVGSWKIIAESERKPRQFQLRGHVLMAEDSDDVRRLVGDALRRAGAEVTAVEDGNLAVRAARAGRFDLVLLDIRMPGLDGLEAAAAIRSMGYGGPMIALTASTTRSEQGRILAAGFDDLWPKPISLEQIIERCADFLETTTFNGERPYRESLCGVQAEFAKKLPDIRQRLLDAISAGRHSEIREILHQLVGTSGIVGFPDVSALAAMVYDEFKAGQLCLDTESLRELCQLMEHSAAFQSPDK